ncbi:MAG TPA: WD40 repeat domain-containing protein [Gemmataceae bacterium]|nr:WD40 repeat domain-containing protein [Gemmataceae bacterium]
MTPFSFRISGVVCIGLCLGALRLPAAPPQVAPSPPLAGQRQVENLPPQRNDCHGDPLPEGALARLGTTRLRHNDGVSHVAYSPDGKLLASTSRDRTLRIWESATGRQVHVFQEKEVDFYAVAWSPDGATLVASCGDHFKGGNIAIRFFDVQTAKETKRLAGHDQAAYQLAFSPDGATLLSVSSAQVIRWNTASGDKLSEWKAHPSAALTVAPDRATLAWVDGETEDKTVHIVDAVTGNEIRRLKDSHEQAIVSIAYSPDGKHLASGNLTEPIQLWDVATGKVVRRFEQQQGGMALKFSADGKTLACGTMDGSVRQWQVETGHELAKMSGYRGWVNAITFSPDCKTLALAGSDSQVIHLWDLASAKECSPAQGHHGQIYAVAFAPNGKLIATGGGDFHDNDECIHLWDAVTGKEVRRLNGHAGKVYALHFSPDSQRLVSGSEKEENFRVWDVVSGTQQAPFKRKEVVKDEAGEYRVSAVAWSPDGKLLASAHDQGVLILWDAQNGAELRCCEGHEGIIHSLAFSHDGKLLVSGGVDRTVRIWKTANGNEERCLADLPDGVKSVAFSPDGRLVAASAGDFDGINYVWETANGREVCKLPAVKGRVYQIAFSPDGKLLAGTGPDNALCVWEIATQAERCRFPGHASGGLAVAFAPDGKTLASGSQDTTVVLWNMAHCPDAALAKTTADFERLWADLGSPDASQAHRAICSLLADPEKAVNFLNQRLRPFSTMDAENMARALDDLDSERYKIREKATSDLALLGELAEPLLRQTLERQPSPEVKQRVQLLLGKLDAAKPPTDQLRALRAFEVLERIGGPQVRSVFEAQLRQMPDGRLGREAQASLDRMNKR